MRAWFFGRSLIGNWIKLFFVALLPLMLTAIAVAIYEPRTIPGRIREESYAWVQAYQRNVDSTLLVHHELQQQIAERVDGQPSEEVEAILSQEEQGLSLVLGKVWLPNGGEPVLSKKMAPLWSEVRGQLEPERSYQLLSLPSQKSSVLAVSYPVESGRQLTILSLRTLGQLLGPPNTTDKWFALVDPDGQELAFHDATARLAGAPGIVSVQVDSQIGPGWAFIGYSSTQPALLAARDRLVWAVLFAVVGILAGLGLAIPAANRLLKPFRRLEEVGRSLPIFDQVAVAAMPQHESATALVDGLEHRILLLEQEHRFFFQEAEIPFVILAIPGDILEINQAMCRLLGYPAEFFVDHRISATLHPEERFRVDLAHPEMMHETTTVHWVWHHLTPDGGDLWIQWSSTSDPKRGLLYAVAQNVTAERQTERLRALQLSAQQLWLEARSGGGLQPLLDSIMAQLERLFPAVAIAIWEEPANGGWLLRAGAPEVDPEGEAAAFEIQGELLRFGVLVAQSPTPLEQEESSLLESIAEMVSTAVRIEQEQIHQSIQHGVNQLLAEARGDADLYEQLLPLIGRPIGSIAARLWAPTLSAEVRLLADWAEPGEPIADVYAMHQWMVQQTLSDGRPRWVAEGTPLPDRPEEKIPVGRITFAVRVGTQVVGCVDCLVPILRTPNAGFLTLLDSVGAQVGLYMERRKAEEERRQQALLASGRGEVLNLVASGAPLEHLLDSLARLAERILPGSVSLLAFFDAGPDRPLHMIGPSVPAWLLMKLQGILGAPGFDQLVLRWRGSIYLGSPEVITQRLPHYGLDMLAIGLQDGWVRQIPIPSRNGTFLFGLYSRQVEGLAQSEPVLTEICHIAQVAVELWWLEQAVNRRIDLLMAHMQEGLVAVDSEAQVVQTNPAGQKILGLSNGSDALPEPLAEGFRQVLLPGAQPFPLHFAVEGAPVYGYLSPVRSGEGALLGAIAILEDSANRQQFQQLQTALVANVSHDLKAPLTALGALIETMVTEEVEPAAQQQYLHAIQAEIARLKRLTNDLLLLARLDAGILPLEPERLAMGDLLQGLSEVWTPRCQAKGLTLSVIGDPVEVWADYDRVIQILTNLMDNAIKYTPPGGSIKLGVESAGPAGVRLVVRDTGVGIAPEHLQRLGSRFYMVDPARERSANSGTGLGLSIVRSLAEVMGGEIQFESVVGQGTTVWLLLPAV